MRTYIILILSIITAALSYSCDYDPIWKEKAHTTKPYVAIALAR